MKQPIFTGVCTALITPFGSHGIDLRKTDELLEQQMEAGIRAVCVCGTTGEASAMSQKEQWDLIAHTVRRCRGKIKVIAGAGSNCTEEAVTKARVASAMGADGILSVTPYYNKAGEAGLAEHFIRIAEASSAPVIVYNVPSRTGLDIPLSVYSVLARETNIVGVKEASGDVSRAGQILAACGEDLFLWSGCDELIVPLMAMGGKGVISVLSNLCPGQTLAMADACQQGNYPAAGRLQRRYAQLISALFCEVNPIPVKEAMNLLGMNVGCTRLPLGGMKEENRIKLREAMKALRLLP